MNALYRLYSAYPLLLRWKRRGGGIDIPADAYRTPDGLDYYVTPDGSDYYTTPPP
jgi:hypothetical protein